MELLIIGEGANFAAYAYAPAILVTPLGALSMIVSAILAHFILKERLHIFGMVGCLLCLVGSVTIVLHAPLEKSIQSVKDVWYLATEPGFLAYAFTVLVLILILIVRFVPLYGQSHLVVYIGICSLAGSLTVMGVKAIGMALKLTFGGQNQFKYFETWFFIIFVLIFCLLQLNYLNKDYVHQNTTQIITELCGFVTILCGTFLLHKTKDMGSNPSKPLPVLLPKTDTDYNMRKKGWNFVVPGNFIDPFNASWVVYVMRNLENIKLIVASYCARTLQIAAAAMSVSPKMHYFWRI
ncbi:hypothetical protein RND71_040033 [Anisodus tanguticus]|uniref:Probable magnesium transporter n=1 Tax=Anisodus tanguticus TaxID=243964 RepID=A0AAE1R095_9SOLA|nr:hypothetical protein RND71_040033 [Anisodus tanguticus]